MVLRNIMCIQPQLLWLALLHSGKDAPKCEALCAFLKYCLNPRSVLQSQAAAYCPSSQDLSLVPCGSCCAPGMTCARELL